MKKLNHKDITTYVENKIECFHQKRIENLDKLKLLNVIKKKNPYLFKAKYVSTSEEIVRGFVDAHISSNEETIFGDWLEGLVVFINNKVYDGRKSGISGIDLEFDIKNTRYIVAIKSGPNWANSSQIKKMKADFTSAERTLRTSSSQLKVVAINGCCYGTDENPEKEGYTKYCGQLFWKFISGDSELFTKIIEPLGYNAKEKNDDFSASYSRIINKFTKEFADRFCMTTGDIDWEKLVRLNSEATKQK